MSCYFNIKLPNFNPERKFKFPGENLNQSEKRILERYYVIIANQLFFNFKLVT